MSSATQIDMDWAGIDSAQTGTATSPPNGVNGARAGAQLTDEEILGIEPVGAVTSTHRNAIPSEARNPSGNPAGAGDKQQRDSSVRSSPRNDNVAGAPISQNDSAAGITPANAMPEWMLAAVGDPKHGGEAQKLWQEHQAFRASFSSPDEARAIKELFPGGAQEAQTLRQAAQAVDQLDAAIYSGDSRAQSEVVAELARANPAAFRQLFAEAAKVLAGMGQVQTGSNQPPTLRETGEGWGAPLNPNASQDPSMASRTSPVTNHESQNTNHPSPSLRASKSRFSSALILTNS